jgi:hypothetical protein
MAKRNPPEKKERHAREVVRNLTTLRGMEGVPWLEEGRLWLLGPVADRPPDPASLARALLADALPDRATFARLIGARHTARLETSRLADWARAVTELHARRDLESLVAEGVRPLRSYRGVDLRGRIASAGQNLARLGSLVQALDAATRCQQAGPDGEVPPEVLVQALPLRLYALGDWAVDPVDELQATDLPADGPLLRLAGATSDAGLAALAALLLGARQRHSHTDLSRTESLLAGTLASAFRAGAAGCPAPCLWALASAAGTGPPPDLTALPPAELSRLVPAAERLALVQGAPAALSVLEALGRPLEGIGRLHIRLRRFEGLVRAHARGYGGRPRSPQEAEVLRGLREMAAPGAGAARVLVELFLRWMGGGRLVPRRALLRAAEAALPGGPAAAARALADAWQKAFRRDEGFLRQVSWDTQRARLALELTHPGVGRAIPADAGADTLENLREMLAGLALERVREVLPYLAPAVAEAGYRAWHYFGRLLATDVPGPLVLRAFRHGVVDAAADFAGNPQGLTRYLDCLDALTGRDVPNLDVRANWFAGLFRSGRPWAPTVVLTLLNQARRQSTPGEHPAELFALSEALAAHGPLAPAGQILVQALEEWGTPAVRQPPAELEALASLPGLDRPALEEYLHHRRLAGHGENFTEALLEPLRQAEQEAREAAFLQKRLAEGGAAAGAHLAARLARLIDSALAAARRARDTDRARKRLERSLALLRQESLERVLDDACRSYLHSLLGRVLPPGPLPAGLREALQLLSAREINHDLLAGFIDDVLRGRPLAERPPNREWLARAEAAGVHTREWLAGFRVTVDLDETPVTFATEGDPLVILKMGSYFDTCLSLGHGANAASTLVNALDVNKHVIYGRLADGTVLARKLIGATLARELAGYHTYAARDADLVRVRLAGVIRDFARRCGLRLSDTATPETLHPGFWYDDGNETWPKGPDRPLALEPTPAGVPADAEATAEWNLCAALASGDAGRLKAVAVHGRSPWREAALYHLLARYPGAVRDLPAGVRGVDGPVVIDWLTAGSHLAAAQALSASAECFPHNDGFPLFYPYLPFDRTILTAALRAVPAVASAVAPRKGDFSYWHFWFPRYAAAVPAGVLLDAVRAVGDLALPETGTDAETNWLDHCTDLLHVIWLRDGDAAPLARALAQKHPLVERLIVGLARREVIPRLAPGLRKLLARGGERVEDVALALGTQGDPQDGPRLLALLRRRPESLAVAAAVVFSGDAASAEEARALWRPPRDLDKVARDPFWLALARAVGSRRLARTLAREVRRCAYALVQDPYGPPYTRIKERALLLWFLGLPGPEGDTAALMTALAQTEPYRKEDYLLRDILKDMAAPAEAAAVGAMADRLARGGPDALAALEWWRLRQAEAAAGKHPRLRHYRFERRMRRLAVRGTPEEQDDALQTWLAQTPEGEEQGQLASRWLPLFGPDLPRLREGLRAHLAGVCWARVRSFAPSEDVEDVLAWLDDLRSEVRRDVVRADTAADANFSRLGQLVENAAPVWLLRLESADPRRAGAAEDLLGAWATGQPDYGLLQTLARALVWLRPDVAEPLVGRVLAEIDVTRLKDKDLLTWLTATPPRSYRLQRALLRALWPRLDLARRGALWDGLGYAEATTRSRWLREQMEQMAEAPT